MPPFFSIIIPTYNSENTIQNALDSISSQTLGDFEIIIVDGLSTDSTIEIIKKYSERDNRIHVISEKDSGVYDAMNKGLRFANGNWLYFLGSDDSLYNGQVLENVYSTIKKSKKNSNFIYGDVYSPHLGGEYGGEFDFNRIRNHNICHQSIFYRNDVFEIIGNYNLKYKIFADWEFNIRCLLNPHIVTEYINLKIAFFSPGGLSTLQSDEIFYNDRNSIIINNGLLSLPLKDLKYHCNSNVEFFKILFKRFRYLILEKKRKFVSHSDKKIPLLNYL